MQRFPIRRVDATNMEADVQQTWMTLPEIALRRHISIDDAQALVDAANCPKVFKTDATLYLI